MFFVGNKTEFNKTFSYIETSILLVLIALVETEKSTQSKNQAQKEKRNKKCTLL